MHELPGTDRAGLVIAAHGELMTLIADGSLMPDRLDSMPTRLRLAEQAVRLAAAAEPGVARNNLARAETLAWIHDPTLYRRALWDGGPEEVRRLMTAITPAATLYADVFGATTKGPRS